MAPACWGNRVISCCPPSIVSTVLAFLWVTCAGDLSDVIGRKRMFMLACVIMGIFGFVYFAMLDTMNPTVMFIAIAISGVPVMTLYGPEAALIAEVVLATPSIQWRVAWLSARLGHRRWPGAVHRDGAVRSVSFKSADRDLYLDMRDHRPGLDRAADGLHQQGDFGRIQKRLNGLAGRWRASPTRSAQKSRPKIQRQEHASPASA